MRDQQIFYLDMRRSQEECKLDAGTGIPLEIDGSLNLARQSAPTRPSVVVQRRPHGDPSRQWMVHHLHGCRVCSMASPLARLPRARLHRDIITTTLSLFIVRLRDPSPSEFAIAGIVPRSAWRGAIAVIQAGTRRAGNRDARRGNVRPTYNRELTCRNAKPAGVNRRAAF
jgi:hypothetical protein